MKWLSKHRETLLVGLLGMVAFIMLNVMMLHYNYDLFTRPKVGFWTAFWEHFEFSGFDPYTYIVVSQWRPLYILSRHPLLAAMMWPLSQLNSWLTDITGVNCAIFIVAALWVILSTASWLLMYRIHRRIIELSIANSLLMTLFFFSFSHVLIITFVCDHMALTLPCLLLAVYLAGKAIKCGRRMSLWQSLPLLFVSTGITTTNMVKVAIADFFTMLGKVPFSKMVRHFLVYLIPLSIILSLYLYQENTTQAEERQSIKNTVEARVRKDSVFADYWKREEKAKQERKRNQTVHLSIATNTEYHIDRLPSLVENVFGEGLLLHSDYALKDANRHRPVLVRYNHWWYYAVEATIVALFLAGIWYGRRQRLLWMVMAMFLFDMLLHVGLNFASADVYIMTAHWAFVIPIAVAYLLKPQTSLGPPSGGKETSQSSASSHENRESRRIAFVRAIVFFLTLFLLVHNLIIIVNHTLHVQ